MKAHKADEYARLRQPTMGDVMQENKHLREALLQAQNAAIELNQRITSSIAKIDKDLEILRVVYSHPVDMMTQAHYRATVMLTELKQLLTS